MDERRFTHLVGRIENMVKKAAAEGGPRIVSNRQVKNLAKNLKKVQAILETAFGRQANTAERLPPEGIHRAEALKSALSGILRSRSLISHEQVMLDRISETVSSLLSNGK